MSGLYILHIQTALFLATLDFIKKLELASAIQAASNGILDGEPVLLPTPPNPPVDLPILIIQSENKTRVCQIAPGRVDVVYQQRLEQLTDLSSSLDFTEHITLTKNIWQKIQSGFKGSAYRIGFVTRRIALEPTAQNWLRTSFLKDHHFDLARELQVHALHKHELASYHVNRWVRLKATPAPEGMDAESILQLEVDINTLPEMHLDLSAEDVDVFSQHALQLTKETVQQFLPQ